MLGADPLMPDGRSGPHTFVADVDSPRLADEDEYHLRRALRLRPGDPLTVSDGRGSWRGCLFGPTIETTGDVVRTQRPEQVLTVGFALTKAAKPDLVVQKLTELGIDAIIPFAADRSVAHWDDVKAAKQHVRLVKIAREAAMQSRRVWLPEVHQLTGFTSLPPSAVRAERGGRSLGPEHSTVLIGPEGGWSADERASGTEVHLTSHVLRAETAAIAAAVLMTSMREQRQGH